MQFPKTLVELDFRELSLIACATFDKYMNESDDGFKPIWLALYDKIMFHALSCHIDAANG